MESSKVVRVIIIKNIFHKLVVVVSLLIASVIGTFLAAALFSRALKGK